MANQNPLATNLTLEQQKNLFGNAYLNMLWHCPTDLRFHYWVHLPDYYYDEEEHEYSLLVIIHGTGCAIEEYIKQAKELADKYHMAVLAPMFPGGLIQRDDFNSYKLLSCDGIRYDLILLDMIEDMAKRYPGVHTDQFFMFGHSGGGQFVNRFLLAHPDRLKACSIGAPGRPTFLNPDEDYFWGIRDFKDYFGYDVDLEAVKKVPVLISVGGGDGAVGAVAVDDVPLFGSRLDILGAGGSGLCTVLRDKHGCGHRCRADGGGDGLPVLFDKGLHARRGRLGSGQQDASEALRMLGAATRVRSTLGRPVGFHLTAGSVI